MGAPLIVTGGAGFIGRAVAHRLASAGHRVLVFDALTYAAHRGALSRSCAGLDVTLVPGDVAEPGALDAALAESGAQAVLHLAAESHVDRALQDASPVLRTNVQGTWEVVRACVRRGARLVQVSTDEVYGDRGDGPPTTEESPASPTNPYAAAKACGDHLVQAAVRAEGLDAVITRGTNTYGPGQFPEKLLPLAARRWLGGQPMGLYGDGEQVRQWLHVDDHAAGIVAALERGRTGEVLHFAGEAATNRDVLARWAAALGVEGELDGIADRPGHDRRYALDDRATRRRLGWAPLVGLDDGLAATALWTRQHRGFWDEAMARDDVRDWFAAQYGTRA